MFERWMLICGACAVFENSRFCSHFGTAPHPPRIRERYMLREGCYCHSRNILMRLFLFARQVCAIFWTALNIKCRSITPISFSPLSFFSPSLSLSRFARWARGVSGESRMALLMFDSGYSGWIGYGGSNLEF